MEVVFEDKKEIAAVKWTIENFSLCNREAESPNFRLITTNTSEEVEFQLLAGTNSFSQNKIYSSFLRSEINAPKKVTLNYTLTFSTTDGTATEDFTNAFIGGTGESGSYNGFGWNIEREKLFKGESPITWTNPLTLTLQVWDCRSNDSDDDISDNAKGAISCLFSKDTNPITDDFILPKDMWSHLMVEVGKVKNKVLPVPSSYFVRTRIHAERVSFTLPIRSFSVWKGAGQKLFHSVISPSKKVPVLVVVLSMLADASSDDNTVQIDIRRADREGSEVKKLICRVAVMNKEGNSDFVQEDTHTFESGEKNQVWTFPQFLTNEKLMAKESLYLPANVLSLRFQLALSTGEHFTEMEDTSYESSKLNASVLSGIKSKI